VAIIDTGSYTKAAEALGLTQPAISAHVARLDGLLGGNIFAKGRGITLTERGLVALRYARRMLSMNAELLAFAGPNSAPRHPVIGLPNWLRYRNLIPIFQRCSASGIEQRVSFRCDRTERLADALNLGSVDTAYLTNAINPSGIVVAEWLEPMVWVKGPKFVLTPGAPVPLVSWPGTLPDQVAVERLQANGTHFFIAFSASDLASRLAAVAAGFGVMPVFSRVITSEMEIVPEGLPPLPEIRAGIFVRKGGDLRKLRPLLRLLTEELAPPSSQFGARHEPVTGKAKSAISVLDEFHI